MSWEDLISHILATTSKVEKVVIYDIKGRPIAVTEDTETSDSEGQAVIHCLNDPAKTLTKLHLDNDVFLCVQGIDSSFVGTSVRNPSRVVVARLEDGHVVAIFGQSAGQGSFIFELKQCLLLRAEGKLLGQDQQQTLVDIDNIGIIKDNQPAASNSTSPTGEEAAVGSDQVLVDFV